MNKKLKIINYTLLLFLPILLTGCQILPTSGPSHDKILNRATDQSDRVNLLELDHQIVNQLHQKQEAELFSGFVGTQRGNAYAGTANVGDELEISIWEAPPAVLFGGTLSAEGQGVGHLTQLPKQMVNKNGTVNVPFVGNVRVAGKTPEAIQTYIQNALKGKANQPQVLVKIANNHSVNVTVIRQGSAIRMPLTANNERVLDAIAAVGGATENIEDITVQLTRGRQVKTLAYETLIADPSQNIPLSANDVVSLLNTPFRFTGLGAVGENKQVRFSSKGITLAEAIGKMGGLIDSRSDPRGIFVFRYVPFSQLNMEQQIEWEGKGYGAGMDVPTVFRVNLLEPQSMFLIQRFPMQDKDIVYVSNAPLAEFQKFLRMIFSISSPVLGAASNINSL